MLRPLWTIKYEGDVWVVRDPDGVVVGTATRDVDARFLVPTGEMYRIDTLRV